MSHETGPLQPEISAQYIIEGFRRLRHPELTYPVDFEEQLTGRFIKASELASARKIGQRAITRWAEKNEQQIIGAPKPGVKYHDLRTHPKSNVRYSEYVTGRFARRSSGVIEAVDAEFESLVIRPRLGRFLGNRHWIRVIGPEDEQLVDFRL